MAFSLSCVMVKDLPLGLDEVREGKTNISLPREQEREKQLQNNIPSPLYSYLVYCAQIACHFEWRDILIFCQCHFNVNLLVGIKFQQNANQIWIFPFIVGRFLTLYMLWLLHESSSPFMKACSHLFRLGQYLPSASPSSSIPLCIYSCSRSRQIPMSR